MDTLYANRYLKILKASPDLLRAAKDAGIPRNDPAAPALCWVMGPALSEFVRWVLTGALRQGVRRLARNTPLRSSAATSAAPASPCACR